MLNNNTEDIEITKYNSYEAQEHMNNIRQINGNLRLFADVNLNKIEAINGDLFVQSNYRSTLTLNNLRYIAGALSITDNKSVDMRDLEIIGGDLKIGDDARLYAPSLQMVKGDLYISGPQNLGNLQSVGGNILLRWGAKLNNLVFIGGNLYVHGYKLSALNLQYLSGNIYANTDNRCDLNQAIYNRKIITWHNSGQSSPAAKPPAKRIINHAGMAIWTLTKNPNTHQVATANYDLMTY